MSHAYRSAYEQLVGVRLAEMKLARETVTPLLPRLRSIRSARLARALAGAVGLAGAAWTVVCAIVGDDGSPTYALLGSLLAAVATYVLARGALAIAGAGVRARGWELPRLTGALDVDLARIDASSPLPALRQRLDALEVWSTTLPLAALSLLMPLTLHYLFLAVVDPSSAESFARWVRLSMVIVGHAHLALMALAIAFGRKLTRLSSEGIGALSIHREWARAWGIVILVAAMPGVLLIAVPPLLSAVTGLVFIPLMFILTRRRLMKERSALDLAEEASTLRSGHDVRVAPLSVEEADAIALGELEEPHAQRALG
ncbi:MAG: hypothetical protein KF894_28045 [Labilithrix sp.]|nr:hypothetical protein [Labilithrix sp.]